MFVSTTGKAMQATFVVERVCDGIKGKLESGSKLPEINVNIDACSFAQGVKKLAVCNIACCLLLSFLVNDVVACPAQRHAPVQLPVCHNPALPRLANPLRDLLHAFPEPLH